jgi:hypothetical protein
MATTSFTFASSLSEGTRACEESIKLPQRLHITMVPGSSIEEEVLVQARLEVEAIWRPYHLDIVWTIAPAESEAGEPDLVLQFVEGMPSHSAHAIAWVFFHQARPLPYVRVSLAAAMRLMLASTWFDGQALKSAPLMTQRLALGRIVGRAIAHEIGHVMLASRLHATSGLMRATIEPAQLMRPGLQFFGLEDGEVDTLRVARLARCEAGRMTLASSR